MGWHDRSGGSVATCRSDLIVCFDAPAHAFDFESFQVRNLGLAARSVVPDGLCPTPVLDRVRAIQPLERVRSGLSGNLQVSHAPEKICGQGQLSFFWALLVG